MRICKIHSFCVSICEKMKEIVRIMQKKRENCPFCGSGIPRLQQNYVKLFMGNSIVEAFTMKKYVLFYLILQKIEKNRQTFVE